MGKNVSNAKTFLEKRYAHFDWLDWLFGLLAQYPSDLLLVPNLLLISVYQHLGFCYYIDYIFILLCLPGVNLCIGQSMCLPAMFLCFELMDLFDL